MAGTRMYVPKEIRDAYEFAARASHRDMAVVQELAIREYLKKEHIKYDFTIKRMKRGPKPKSS